MITRKKLTVSLILAVALSAVVSGIITWLATGGYTVFMPPVTATIEQDESQYGEKEKSAILASKSFWAAMESADETGMRAIAHESCTFVHIGMTCELDEEIGFYKSGVFKPAKTVFYGRTVKVFGDAAIVITDCDYSLKIGGVSAAHHFAVTEVYTDVGGEWKLIQFTFTDLVS